MTQTTTPQDQRRFTRVPFDAKIKVTLNTPSSYQFEAMLVDISFKGLMIDTSETHSIELGSTGTASVILSSGNIEFDLLVSVKHIENTNLGLQVDQMPIEAAEHLRSLMLHNLGNEKLLQREFHALVVR